MFCIYTVFIRQWVSVCLMKVSMQEKLFLVSWLEAISFSRPFFFAVRTKKTEEGVHTAHILGQHLLSLRVR